MIVAVKDISYINIIIHVMLKLKYYILRTLSILWTIPTLFLTKICIHSLEGKHYRLAKIPERTSYLFWIVKGKIDGALLRVIIKMIREKYKLQDKCLHVWQKIRYIIKPITINNLTINNFDIVNAIRKEISNVKNVHGYMIKREIEKIIVSRQKDEWFEFIAETS